MPCGIDTYSSTFNPAPKTLHHKTQAPIRKTQTPDLKPQTLNPKPQLLAPVRIQSRAGKVASLPKLRPVPPSEGPAQTNMILGLAELLPK